MMCVWVCVRERCEAMADEAGDGLSPLSVLCKL